MDRTFEEIRSDVMHLDHESQRLLADEIEEHLAADSGYSHGGAAELRHRVEQHRNGKTTYVSTEDSLAKGRALIESVKRKKP